MKKKHAKKNGAMVHGKMPMKGSMREMMKGHPMKMPMMKKGY